MQAGDFEAVVEEVLAVLHAVAGGEARTHVHHPAVPFHVSCVEHLLRNGPDLTDLLA